MEACLRQRAVSAGSHKADIDGDEVLELLDGISDINDILSQMDELQNLGDARLVGIIQAARAECQKFNGKEHESAQPR